MVEFNKLNGDNKMTQPEYIQQQIDQRVRDRQHAIDLAIEILEEAKANFKK
jgi:hypothetical protein